MVQALVDTARDYLARSDDRPRYMPGTPDSGSYEDYERRSAQWVWERHGGAMHLIESMADVIGAFVAMQAAEQARVWVDGTEAEQ
jgi:hypothetical protein